jgi:hypothetical protein
MVMARVTTRLFVESEGSSVEELSKAIGLACDTSRRKGEPLPGRPGFTARINSWRLEIGTETVEDPDQINKQISALLWNIMHRMRGHEDAFKAAGSLGDCGLLIGVRAASVPPIILGADILRAITSLEVDLQMDLVIG